MKLDSILNSLAREWHCDESWMRNRALLDAIGLNGNADV